MEADSRPTTISGQLRGDPTLEGGCAWLETAEGNFEVSYPPGWRVELDPVVLRDPHGNERAGEGDIVTVAGWITDQPTTCQVGWTFQADAVSGTADDDLLVRFVRTGGFAGFNDELKLRRNGSGRIESRHFGQRDLTQTRPPKTPIRDLLLYSVTYQGRTVSAAQGSLPVTLEPALNTLTKIMSSNGVS